MSDITTVWAGSNGDFQVAGSGLRSGNDLATAVLISLFTDAALPADDMPPDGTDDPRGWWGGPTGSLLWTLKRAKRSQDTVNAAIGFAQAALQWLIADGVAAAVDVYAEWVEPSQLSMQVTVRRTDGTAADLRYSWAWADTLN